MGTCVGGRGGGTRARARGRETDRQTDRQTDRERDRDTEREAVPFQIQFHKAVGQDPFPTSLEKRRYMGMWMYKKLYITTHDIINSLESRWERTHTHAHTHTHTHTHRYRQTDRQTERQI